VDESMFLFGAEGIDRRCLVRCVIHITPTSGIRQPPGFSPAVKGLRMDLILLGNLHSIAGGFPFLEDLKLLLRGESSCPSLIGRD
jgi:hypothetical protein